MMRVFLPLVIVSCTQVSSNPDAGNVQRFGEPLGDSPRVELDQVVAEPERFEQSVTVEGTVRKVCQAKGCWMELVSTAGSAARVTFENYGFFVPSDSAGARATVEGRLEIKGLSPDDVKHMEREGASSLTKTEDGSAREVRLVARGVELRRGG